MFTPFVDLIVRPVYVDPASDTQTGSVAEAEPIEVEEGHFASREHVMIYKAEVDKLTHLKHDNILRYMGTSWESPEPMLNLFLEHFPGKKPLSSILKDRGPLNEADIRKYTRQILLGLEYLHRNNIPHRRILAENILVDDNGHVKLAEFGVPKQLVDMDTDYGTWRWRNAYWTAPEAVRGPNHDHISADIWSVGCTVIEMAAGKHPWSGKFYRGLDVLCSYHKTVDTNSIQHPPIPCALSLEAKNFLEKCLQGDPKLRPSTSELLQDPFVTSECGETCLGLDTSALGISRNGVENSTFASGQSVSEDYEIARSKTRATLDNKTQELKKVNCRTSPERGSGLSFSQ